VADGSADQARLVDALARGALLGRRRQGGGIRVIETHISYVLLTGAHAYKIKKAVKFEFLDFTTLPVRRHCCEEELRLNRRLAPEIYLDVVAITGTFDDPEVGGTGEALEYAVRMREFPQDALASVLLARNELSGGDIDALADQVAAFHASAEVARAEDGFGVPQDILGLAAANLAQIRTHATTLDERDAIEALAAWTGSEYLAREPTLRARRDGGFIRECHGDLHLGNMARVNGRLTIFDCIEFNAAMRWIDVMSEIAFTVMDLEDRGRRDLARRFLNAYLEITGDYAGVRVLRFYLAYRALVRAKIHRLRAAQLESGAAQASALAEYRGYVDLARSYARQRRAAIVLTHGPSGCGKTALSQALLEATEAVRIRTDVERKRLHALAPRERGGADIGRGLYTPEATDATYRRARALAAEVVSAGFVALVDATSLQRWQRDLFRTLASDLGVPFVIVAFVARESVMRWRIERRAAEGGDASDADLAVLEHQLRTRQPLADDERADVVDYDAERSLESARLPETWRGVLDRIERP